MNYYLYLMDKIERKATLIGTFTSIESDFLNQFFIQEVEVYYHTSVLPQGSSWQYKGTTYTVEHLPERKTR